MAYRIKYQTRRGGRWRRDEGRYRSYGEAQDFAAMLLDFEGTWQGSSWPVRVLAVAIQGRGLAMASVVTLGNVEAPAPIPCPYCRPYCLSVPTDAGCCVHCRERHRAMRLWAPHLLANHDCDRGPF